MKSVENMECGKSGVWKMRTECGKCGVWKMGSVENACLLPLFLEASL